MKTKTFAPLLRLLALTLALSLQPSALLHAAPLGAAFTYQGQLADGADPAHGNYDLQFTLYDAASDGTAVAGPLIGSPVGVSNGLFTVMLDFGNSFDGNARWLEIGVRPHGSVSDFVTLWPRQPLTASPYALYAPSAGMAATAASVPLSALPASVPRLDTDLRMNVTGDLSVVAPSGPPLFAEGFEGATFPPAGWVSGGNAPWSRTTNTFSQGAASAASGTIGHNQSSYLEFTCNVPGAALLTFDWKVDSESGWDYLRVAIDGIQQFQISGSQNWTPVTFPLSAGTRTIRWSYTKDGSVSVGQDRGWVDNVRVMLSASGMLSAEALRVSGNAYFSNRVGIGTMNPARPLHIGDANVPGSEALIRLASRSTNSGEYRIWDIGVPQTGTNVTGAGYSFVIDDTLLGTGPEFVVQWGTGRVGIGRTNPVSALDVNGTVTATGFAGNASGLTNLNATQITGTLSTNQIAPGTISGAMLANGAVGPTELAANSVDGSKIVDGSLTSADLASDAASLARVSGGAMTAELGGISIGTVNLPGGPFQVYGEAATVDQEQATSNGSIHWTGTQWQSFTVGATGTLAAVELNLGSYGGVTPWSATLRIREGEGTGGTILSTQVVRGDANVGPRIFPLATPFEVVEGQQYTIAISTMGVSLQWRIRVADVYAGGQSSYNAANDYWFRTYLADATSRPALVIQPATLNVGIGIANPAATLHVNGSTILSGNTGIGTTTPGFPLAFPNVLGDKISLWGQSGAHYGLGVQSGRLQVHSDSSSSDIVFGYGQSTNFTETVRMKGNGNVGIGTNSPARTLHVNDVMRLQPRGTAPSSPAAGDMYFDSTSSKLRVHDGTTWRDCW
jgi:hypothetical protein